MPLLNAELCTFLHKKAGLSLVAGGQTIIENRLEILSAKYQLKAGQDIIHLAQTNPSFQEELLSAVTIHETLWFRDSHPFQNIMGLMADGIGKSQPLKVWSGACSTGQEPYSLKMTQLMKHPTLELDIFATDICRNSIEAAKRGQFDSFSMSRGIDSETRQRYFESEGNFWKIRPEVQRGIRFQQHNLTESLEKLPTFDLILLRNVIIYFPMAVKKDLIQRLEKKLHLGGILLLGGCESIVGMSPQLKLRSLGPTVYYEKVKS